MKFTPSIVLDAPSYYVDHISGRYNTDKCVVLRDKQLETDSELMITSLKHLPKNTNILDLTNNDLFAFPNLASFKELHTLLLSRNRIVDLDGKLLPCNLQNLVLASNGISELSSLNGLAKAPTSLKNVCLRGNQICHLSGYREYVLALLPQLETLDFSRVTPDQKERIGKVSTVTKQELSSEGESAKRDKSIEMMNFVVGKMTAERRKELKLQLAQATSLQEISKLEKLLSGGV
ncbi:hypothetical protein NCAS_0A01020 [Naumovozyma castellii]|uniref:U2 small nuclear ribonucleoprotein A' n=1 Tax=Naumovozyma castellii TaxID=27288 RepID=G0V5C6_NAUCA|nr:hypothetical protein NCAS_0A01020 [Naumovozyma castellii CBS 4309]CCC66662.1 hypothetical protein NCAS_0A01020 [Naumovozyma castellii CBS 4309]